MESFIREVLKKLSASTTPLSEITFILPSKRAGSYLLKELSSITSKNIFAPEIFSIEEFTEKISGLQTIDNTISLFEFYEAYKKITPKEELDDFETFITWAQILIHDINEIDRYLIDYRSFFDYLSGIQDLKHWSLQEEKTELIERYLKFWKKLPEYYESLTQNLLEKDQGYQGLIYRKAAENINNYISENRSKHVFIGFNALNTSEQKIIQSLLERDLAEVFWDLDISIYQEEEHAASIFIRDYLKKWDYYTTNNYKLFSHNYSEEKNIEVIGAPKNIGQAKYLGDILKGLSPEQLENTAIVLGEEELLLPVLNSLPDEIDELNITMGFPVKNAPVNSLFESLFELHLNDSGSYYHKEVIALLKHPGLNPILKDYGNNLVTQINSENLVYLDFNQIASCFPEEYSDLIEACFSQKNDSVEKFIEDAQKIIHRLKRHLNETENKLALEFLYHFHTILNKLDNLNSAYPYLKSIKALHGFYREMLATETLDFQGRPFQGLQLMGMLESRALDFENVIITSLNEGTLPAGKSDNSFIPYDLKQEYNLPTYREKDAVYTYHFYRLLQRAKNIYLLYNTEAEGLNSGEKSRFITQLELKKRPTHNLRSYFVTPQVPGLDKSLKEVKKTPEMIERLKSLAASGFSPSALTTYMRNPVDFYHQYILGVRDQEEMEETVAFNTLGTVVHNALENLYKDHQGEILTEDLIKSFIKRADQEVKDEFGRSYSKVPMKEGKNLLIFEVAKRYLRNFLYFDLDRIKKGDEIIIHKIEKDYKAQLSQNNLPFSVYLRGKIDRFEICNGVPRIIDYKTGKVESRHLNVENWEEITKDYDKYSKSFQVLTYASLVALEKDLTFPAEAGVISFKNLRSGFLQFEKKEPGTRKKDGLISENTLELFQEQLGNLVKEICDPEVPFVEKEISKKYGSF